jgi:hypothetical protein
MKMEHCLFADNGEIIVVTYKENKGKIYIGGRLVKDVDVSTLFTMYCKMFQSKKFKKFLNKYSLINKNVDPDILCIRGAISNTYKIMDYLKERYCKMYDVYTMRSIRDYGVTCWGHLQRLADMLKGRYSANCKEYTESLDVMFNTDTKPLNWKKEIKNYGLPEDCTFNEFFKVHETNLNQQYFKQALLLPDDERGLTADKKVIPIMTHESPITELNDRLVGLHEDIMSFKMVRDVNFAVNRDIMESIKPENKLTEFAFNFHIVFEETENEYYPIIISVTRDNDKILIEKNTEVEDLTETNFTNISVLTRMGMETGSCYRTVIQCIVPDDEDRKPIIVSEMDTNFILADPLHEKDPNKKPVGFKYNFIGVVGLRVAPVVDTVKIDYFTPEMLIGLANTIYKVYATRRKANKYVTNYTKVLRQEIKVSTEKTYDHTPCLVALADIENLVKSNTVYAPHKIRGHHASPRKHYRREFIRHYKNGREVVIHGTWVNEDKDVINYRVKGI